MGFTPEAREKAGQTTLERHGVEFYRRIGAMRRRGYPRFNEQEKASQPGGSPLRVTTKRGGATTRTSEIQGTGAVRCPHCPHCNGGTA